MAETSMLKETVLNKGVLITVKRYLFPYPWPPGALNCSRRK